MNLDELIYELSQLRRTRGGKTEVRLYIPDRDYGDEEEPIQQIWHDPEDDYITLVH